MFNREQGRIGVAYVALQVVIWVKSAFFFALFGHGKSMPFSFAAFPAEALAFDFYFHNSMHVLIAVLALLFGKSTPRLELPKLIAIVFAAVALHNVAYWFTATHSSAFFSAVDFARDSLLLLCFVVAGYALGRAWKALQQKN